MAVIFDLDQTLLDTNLALELRGNRQWSQVYSLIPRFKPYKGIDKVLVELTENNIPVAIVTKSPRPYCEKIISHFKWPVTVTVCYHDTDRKKPYPDPIQLAIKRLGVKNDNVVSIGDHRDDVTSSNSANVFSIGALWGCEDVNGLNLAKPMLTVASVEELQAFLAKRFKLPSLS